MENKVFFDLSEEQSKRFNILKIIFAILVVYNHSYSTSINFDGGSLLLEEPNWLAMLKYTISSIIALCSNYGFFLMSSILLYRKAFTWKDNIKKKIKSLLIPYLIMNVLWIAIFGICQSIPTLSSYFGNQENIIANYGFIEWLGAFGLTKKYPYLAPMWFLKYLFVLNILVVVIKKIIDKAPKIIGILLIVIYLFVPSTSFALIDVEYICIWCLGYYIVKYNFDINKLDNKKWIIVLYIVLIILNICIFKNMITNNILSLILTRLNYLIGVIFWYSCVSKIFINNKAVLSISKYSFVLYLFHQYGLDFLKKICIKLLPISNTTLLLEYFVLPIIMIVLVIVFANVFGKTMPRLYAIVTGERNI